MTGVGHVSGLVVSRRIFCGKEGVETGLRNIPVSSIFSLIGWLDR